MENENRKNTFAYKLGTVIGTILLACATAIVVALTIKFIGWIF